MGERVRGHTKHLGKEEQKGVMPPTWGSLGWGLKFADHQSTGDFKTLVRERDS